jgi:hypothetical protein
MTDGRNRVIFLPAVVLFGPDIWKAFGNIARQVRGKPLAVKDTVSLLGSDEPRELRFLKKSKPSLVCRGINPPADKGKRKIVTLE